MTIPNIWSRRSIIQSGAACAALMTPGIGVRFANAATPGDKRFVVIILRGGLDGLAAVPAHGDPDYAAKRGALALPNTGPGAPIDLDGMFGLHPSLATMGQLWAAKELVVFHNVSTPYRDRSHFDAQNVLETGAASPHAVADGWLNRALQPLGLGNGAGALAVSSSPPLMLDGKVRVSSWVPSRMPMTDEDYMTRVKMLYANDAVLSSALDDALVTRATAQSAMHADAAPNMAGQGQNNQGQNNQAQANRGDVVPLMEGVGKILAADDGPRVAVFDISGWDTHFNQGAGDGQLARRLQALDQGIAALKESLGPVWKKTAVVAASEFGRTVAINGTGGTDHGTAGIAFLMGGAVSGGTIHAEWVGLKNEALRDGRDLPARTDTRAIFKASLSDHLGIATNALNAQVFPDTGSLAPIKGLFA